MIKFISLQVEGFGSIIKPLSFRLDQKGINVISAKNGQGKTTIFSALFWVLYGKTLKKNSSVSTWESERGEKWRGTRVSVFFSKNNIHYKVYAHENYKGITRDGKGKNRLMLIENGIERNDLRDKKDIRNEIIKIIGYSPELFKNTIIFGQKMKRIIEEDGPVKKKIFDDIFDITYLKSAKDKVDKNLIDMYSNNTILLNQQAHEEEMANSLYQQYRSHLSTIKNFTENKEVRKKECYEKIAINSNQILDLEKKIKTMSKFDPDMAIKKYTTKLINYDKRLRVSKTIGDEKFKLEFRIENIKGGIDSENNIVKRLVEEFSRRGARCLTCKQNIVGQDRITHKKHLKQEIKNAKERAISLRESLKPLEEQIKRYNEELELNKDIEHKIASVKANLSLQQAKITTLNSSNEKLERLKKENTELINRVKSIEAEKLSINLSDIKDRYLKAKKRLEATKSTVVLHTRELKIQQWLVKEPLSNSGIKAFIFNSMLGDINNELHKYFAHIGFKINFGIDLDSGNKDFYITIEKKNKLRHYDDLSGSQQQLVNICIAFAVHDVVARDKPCNLLMMDEVLESLDSDNTQLVSSLISQKSIGKCVYIITHNQDFFITNAHIIRLRMKQGSTTISN